MARTVKNPDERKAELLDVALRLFVERGFDAVSMRDIARAADVTPGLAYHYFDSKQNLFGQALDAYADACAEGPVRVLDDPAMDFSAKTDALMRIVLSEEHLPYHEFFHKAGNRSFHDQLSARMCDKIRPHLSAAISAEAARRGRSVRSPETLADFIGHGLINLLSDPDVPDEHIAERVRDYVNVLVDSQMDEEGA